MKPLWLLISLSLLTFNAIANNRIVGKWHDKSDPKSHIFEFKKGQDFVYTHRWKYQGKSKNSKSIGVWESGVWTITSKNGNKASCNLTIYADTRECCFGYKFIAKNLILTIKHTNNGYTGNMCDNRVLVKQN